MLVAISNVIAVLGGIALIVGLVWAARLGNDDREQEQIARDYFTQHGRWPDD